MPFANKIGWDSEARRMIHFGSFNPYPLFGFATGTLSMSFTISG